MFVFALAHELLTCLVGGVVAAIGRRLDDLRAGFPAASLQERRGFLAGHLSFGGELVDVDARRTPPLPWLLSGSFCHWTHLAPCKVRTVIT